MQHTEQGLRPPFHKHGIRKPPGGYADNDGSQQTEISWRHAARVSAGFNKATISSTVQMCAATPAAIAGVIPPSEMWGRQKL